MKNKTIASGMGEGQAGTTASGMGGGAPMNQPSKKEDKSV